MTIQENIQMKFGCAIVYGPQLTKSKKNVEELFSAVECLIIAKLITAEGSLLSALIFLFFVVIVFYWFHDSIDQQFVDHVDEIDGCQRVIQFNNLLTMNEPPPTRYKRFSSDVIYFDEICDSCKKHYIKKFF